MCIYTYMHTCGRGIWPCLGARGVYWHFLYPAMPWFYVTLSLTELGDFLLSWAVWLVSPPGTSCLHPPVPGLHTYTAFLYEDARDINLGPHTWVASTLTPWATVSVFSSFVTGSHIAHEDQSSYLHLLSAGIRDTCSHALFSSARASCMLGKHSTNRTMSPVRDFKMLSWRVSYHTPNSAVSQSSRLWSFTGFPLISFWWGSCTRLLGERPPTGFQIMTQMYVLVMNVWPYLMLAPLALITYPVYLHFAAGLFPFLSICLPSIAPHVWLIGDFPVSGPGHVPLFLLCSLLLLLSWASFSPSTYSICPPAPPTPLLASYWPVFFRPIGCLM